ncbi:MAG: PepSY-like domain-containing protein [Bacteroidales bacterium]|nr:PepSY-like domain-containing protein [Bacteroidales bacterium]
MKKLFFIAISLIMATMLYAEDYKSINFEQLPASTRKLVNAHFADNPILAVKATDTWFRFNREYKIIFDDGLIIDFDSDGQWSDVECYGAPVPFFMLPDKIVKYVRHNFHQEKIIEIKKLPEGYKIEYDSGIELLFDKNSELVSFEWE